MKNQIRAEFHEAKWFYKNRIPTMDEYMKIALASSTHEMLAITSLVGMGDIITKDAFEWILNDPKVLRALKVIGRLLDDIVSHEVLCYLCVIIIVSLTQFTHLT
jgi:(-)-germacrene D synthase